jgi:hypothetical protein
VGPAGFEPTTFPRNSANTQFLRVSLTAPELRHSSTRSWSANPFCKVLEPVVIPALGLSNFMVPCVSCFVLLFIVSSLLCIGLMCGTLRLLCIRSVFLISIFSPCTVLGVSFYQSSYLSDFMKALSLNDEETISLFIVQCMMTPHRGRVRRKAYVSEETVECVFLCPKNLMFKLALLRRLMVSMCTIRLSPEGF